MAKNTLELRKKQSTSEFYRLSQMLAKDYALTPASIARSVFLERYQLTESTYYTLLEFAVTHHLVDEKLMQNIREKILANGTAHGSSGYSSTVKYNKLEEERKKYSAFSKKDIAYITTFYATNPQYTKEQTANIFGFYSTKVLDQLFKKACIELIISDKIFQKLKNRGIAKAKDIEFATLFFENLEQERKEAKKKFKEKSVSAF